MAVAGEHKIEILYKKAAGLRIAKNKIKELSAYIDEKFHDLLIVAQANAKYNQRDVIALSDLPLSKAFKETMQSFVQLEEELALKEILVHMATLPPKYELEIEAEQKLPEIVGTLIVTLARITKEFSKDNNVVSEDEHEAAQRVMNLIV